MIGLISNLFELIFTAALLLSIWKYDVFGKLPMSLQVIIYGSLGLSGISGLLNYIQ